MKLSCKLRIACASGLILTALTATARTDRQTDTLTIIKPHGSELRIDAAGFGVTLGNDNTYIYSDSFSGKKKRQPRISTSIGIASLDFGFNVLDGVRYYGPWADSGDFLDMNGGKSVRVAWEPAAMSIAIDRGDYINFGIGIRLSVDNYSFSEPYTIRAGETGILMPEKLEGFIKKSKFAASYIGIPVKLSFRLGHGIYLTGYASGDILLHAHTKYKKPKVKDNLPCISPWKISAGGCVSFHDIGIYCDYGITPLFKKGTGAEANTISIGLRLGL